MDVHIIQDQPHLTISDASAKALVEGFVSFHHIAYDEVSVYFVDLKKICEMHAQFFDDPSPTDCISFPMDDAEEEGYRVMGDIFVCPEAAIQYVASHGGDVYKELTLYVVHGLLHLIGYDDVEDADRQEMRAAEASFLKYVEKNKLWLFAPLR